MKQGIFEITANRPLTGTVFEMRLKGDTSAITAPGQFVNLRLDRFYLRRPISVCDLEGDELTLVYKTVGEGTSAMSRLKAGEHLDVLSGLGNGYDMSCSGDEPLLIGGGVGVAPLYLLARRLRAQGRAVAVILGFNTADEVFFEDRFRELGCSVTVTTIDGSCGRRGFVTDALPDSCSYVYTCGPEPMLKAVFRAVAASGQFSFEERMGCGFGACMGCSCKTVTGYKRICKDGPVLRKEEILWDD